MKDILSAQSRSFMDMFGLKYPIVQAGMDGAASPKLVIAVANAGGLGTLPLGFREPAAALEQIHQVQEKTNQVFLANFVLNFSPQAFSTALDAGVRAFLFSWGLPSEYMVNQLRAASNQSIMGIQVSDANGAKKAMELKPDFLVVQGIEAGGHVQGNKPLKEALSEVLQQVAGAVPVVAAGGIATGAQIQTVLSMGAAAVVMGTRFVATQESAAHESYKQELIQAQNGATDTVLTVCLNKVWPNATHRLLRTNMTFQMWESNGRPPGPSSSTSSGGTLNGNRPGEHDIVALDADGNTTWERYVDVVPVQDMKYCDVNALGTFAGQGVGDITDIPTVAELMDRLMEEQKNDDVAERKCG